ncbi:MAG: PHP domain-containing protein [bacterium]
MELGGINEHIGETLEAIADLLEMKGENIYRVMAFRKAARTILNLPRRIERKEDVIGLPNIGKGIGDIIGEILTRGTSSLYKDLTREIPEGVREFVQIYGIGPKTAYNIYKSTGASSLDELYEIVSTGRLRDFPGLKESTIEKILSGIEKAIERKRLLRLDQGYGVYLLLKDALKGKDFIDKVMLVGGVRRGKEINDDVDVVISTRDRVQADSFIRSNFDGKTLDIKFVEPGSFIYSIFLYTGSKTHTEKVFNMIRKKNNFLSEEDIYKRANLQFVPPEMREDIGEIELAKKFNLPELVNLSSIKGDLHTHSLWSDGTANILDMANECIKHGYEYMAVTDHSSSLKVAGGLSPEEIEEQHKELALIADRLGDFTILKGLEVDILPDGSLDMPEEALRSLDIVIASIHTSFRMEEKEMTERIVKAISNPYVNILGHPTGRVLLMRDPYKVDMEKIFKTAAERGVILEINSSPERLDLNESLIKEGKRYGVKFAVNTDAHSIMQLDNMFYGIITARRGWLEKKDIINTYDISDLLRLIRRRD